MYHLYFSGILLTMEKPLLTILPVEGAMPCPHFPYSFTMDQNNLLICTPLSYRGFHNCNLALDTVYPFIDYRLQRSMPSCAYPRFSSYLGKPTLRLDPFSEPASYNICKGLDGETGTLWGVPSKSLSKWLLDRLVEQCRNRPLELSAPGEGGWVKQNY